jgi:4-diphosphocytidyl-2-C-methyl-D-erythritol kinase
MINFPNAKINIGLNIVGKRPDGYHNLETIFFPIGWKDSLEIIPAKATTLALSGIPIQGDADKNLVIKALQLIKNDFPIEELSVYLQKNIPFGAGLGGGSADGAFMLRLLNSYFKLNLSDEQLAGYAVGLGADCPFFIHNKPMFASGIGDCLEPVDMTLGNNYLVVVKPNIAVSTVEAYSMVVPKLPSQSLKTLIQQPIETWRETIVNDFESSVFAKYPAIAQLKEQLYQHGALYASMSGSGSAVYGIFPPEVTYLPVFPDSLIWSNHKN